MGPPVLVAERVGVDTFRTEDERACGRGCAGDELAVPGYSSILGDQGDGRPRRVGRVRVTFDEAYFDRQYRDYARQNPLSKVAWYIDFARPWLRDGPLAHLDVGCGLGALIAHTATLDGCGSHGIDISTHAVEVTRRRCPDADVRIGTADQQLWQGTSFGLITMMDVLEHLDDPVAALRSARAQLAPEGALLISLPVYEGFCGPVIRRLDRDPTHLHKWPRQRWLDLIGGHFEIRRWSGVFRNLPPVGPYIHRPSSMLRRHAPAVVIVANC